MSAFEKRVEAAARAVHAYMWKTGPWEDMPERYQLDLIRQERVALQAADAVVTEEQLYAVVLDCDLAYGENTSPRDHREELVRRIPALFRGSAK